MPCNRAYQREAYLLRKKAKADTGSYYTSDPPLDPDAPALNEVEEV